MKDRCRSRKKREKKLALLLKTEGREVARTGPSGCGERKDLGSEGFPRIVTSGERDGFEEERTS
jgi:hypothetical protein